MMEEAALRPAAILSTTVPAPTITSPAAKRPGISVAKVSGLTTTVPREVTFSLLSPPRDEMSAV
ncbi:hypothetical protein ES703_01518 [subsurface metagenome]